MEAEALVGLLASASQKQLAQLQSDAVVPQLAEVFRLLWARLLSPQSLHSVFEQAHVLSSLLVLQAKWRFPLEIAPLVGFLTHFFDHFVCENPLLWNEEHLRDCESVLQTTLKYVQVAEQGLPTEMLESLLTMLRTGSKFPKDVCTQLGLMYHSGLQCDLPSRMTAVGELSGQGKLAYLRGVIFCSNASALQQLLPEVLCECRSPDVSLKHYAVNVRCRQTVEVLLTKMKKQQVALGDEAKKSVGEMLSQHFDYPDKAVCMRILHVLALLLEQYSAAEAAALLERIHAVKSSLKYRLLSEVIQVFGLDLILQRFPDIVLQCAEQTLHPSSSSPAMELLRRVFTAKYTKGSLTEYFDMWKGVLSMPQPAPLVLEEALRICKGECTEMIVATKPPLHTLVTVLKVCRSLKNFRPSETGVVVFSCEVPLSDLEAALTSVDLDLAADCLEVLTASPMGSAALSSMEIRLFLTYIRFVLKVSDAHFRQRSMASCKKLLIRARVSLDSQPSLRPEYTAFLQTAHSELLSLVYPTAPIELLEPALGLLDQIYQLFGSAPCTIGDRAVAALSQPLFDLYTAAAKNTIFAAMQRPWELVRRLCFRMMSSFPHAAEPIDLDAEMLPLASPRVHEAEAQAWRLLLHIRRENGLFEKVLGELAHRADTLMEIISERRDALLPHGLMSCIRFALELGEEFAAPTAARMQQLANVLLTVSRQTSILLSKFAVDEGWDCRGHACGSEPEVTTMGMWLASKENGLLLSQYAQWMLVTPATLSTVTSLASEFFHVLLSLKHRGSIVKTASGLADYYSRLFREALTASEPITHLRKLLDLVKSSEDRALILRRSAGFPYALLAILQSAPRTTFTATMEELLGLAGPEENSEVRIHALNILRHVLQDRMLKTKSEQFLAASLQAGVLALSSPDWSVRNSATLTFAAVISKALGHEFKLTLSDLTARNAALEGHLVALLGSSADPYPVLLLLQRLVPDNVRRANLTKSVLRHIGSPNDMVRRVAAEALSTLVSTVTLYRDSLDLDGEILQFDANNLNRVHGVLLVLGANIEKVKQSVGLKEVFGTEWARVPLIGETYLRLRVTLRVFEEEHGVRELVNRYLRCEKLRFEKDVGHSLTRLRMVEFLLDSTAEIPDLYESVASTALSGPSGDLHLDDPEFTHSVLKHLRKASAAPAFVDNLCLRVLAVVDPSFASCWKAALQVLSAHDSLPDWDSINAIRARKLSHSPLQSVVVKCLLKVSTVQQASATALILLQQSSPEEKDFVRSACAEALGENLSLLSACIQLWRVAFRLLQDQVEAIRQLTAIALSHLLCAGQPKNATVVLRMSFAHVAKSFPAEAVINCLTAELLEACKVRKFEFSEENKRKIFYKEPVNCFEEPLRVALLALEHLAETFVRHPQTATSAAWVSARRQVLEWGEGELAEEERFLIAAVHARLPSVSVAL